MAALRDEVMGLAHRLVDQHGLAVEFTHHDRFTACANHSDAATAIMNALDSLGISHDGSGLPMRASEDFGLFGHHARSAMFLLGADPSPSLHNHDYDFPDALIPQGVAFFECIRQDLLG